MEFDPLDDKYYILKELLKLDIKNNNEKNKFIILSNKFNDLVDKKINTKLIYYDFKEAKIIIAGCLYYEKVDQELTINFLKYGDASSSELINKHNEYINIIREVINKYNL